MSTSLARQLEQLRTSSSVGAKPGKTSSVASSGPSILDLKTGQELTNEQLEILAKEAFNQLSGNLCITTGSIKVLTKFKSLIFSDSKQEEDEDIDMEEEPGINFESLLIILGPHLRQTSMQFLLQYLINHHKLHDLCTEWLFFNSLQHYEYTLFNRIVDSLPLKRSAEESRPRWVEHFRSACHPATTIGLHRHLACDRGFFSLLCEKFIDVARNHVPIFGKGDNVSYNGMIECFVKALVGALNLVGSISEQQTHLIMQAIVAALKCDHREFRAAGSILFSVLIPRVKLNQKAANKLLKVLVKLVNNGIDGEIGGNLESLGMVAILYRCQSTTEGSTVDKSKVLELVLKHDLVIKECTTQINQMEDDDKEFARRLFKMLAILANDVTSDGSATEPIASLLELIVRVLVSSSTWSTDLLPTSEVAEILIETTSKLIIQYKSLKKKSKKGKSNANTDAAVGEAVRGRSVVACKTILDYLRDKFQDEYCAKFKADMKCGSDILFMDQANLAPGNGVIEADYKAILKGPTPEQIAVKQLILDNTFIKEMSKTYVTFKRKYRIRESKELLNENANAIKVLFEKATPSFLLRQVSPQCLVKLFVNCIKAYERKPKVLSKLLTFALNEEFFQNSGVQEELRSSQISLDLIFLQQLCVVNFDCKEEIAKAIEKYSKYSKLEIFSQILVTINVGKDQVSDANELTELVLEKLITLVTSPILMKFMDDIIEGNTGQQEPDIVTITIILSAILLSRTKQNKNLKKEIKLQYELISKMLTVGFLACQEFEIDNLELSSEIESNLFEVKNFNKLVRWARDKKYFPLQTFDVLLSAITLWVQSKSLLDLKEDEKTTLRTRVLALSLICEKKRDGKKSLDGNFFPELVEKELCEHNEAIFESFVAEILFLPQGSLDLTIWGQLLEKEKSLTVKTSKTVSFEIKQKCADHLAKMMSASLGDVTKSSNQLKRLVSLKSPTMPLLLASLTSNKNHKKVVKTIFNYFEAAVHNPASIALDSASYLPLIKHLTANRSSVMAGCGDTDKAGLDSNIKVVMHSFFQTVKEANCIISGLLNFVIKFKVIGIFEPLMPFVSEIEEKSALQEISNYGCELLSDYKKDPISTSKALELLLSNFLPNIFSRRMLDEDEICWNFLCTIVKEHRIKIIYKDELKSVSEFSLEVLNSTILIIRDDNLIGVDRNELVKKTFDLLIDLGKDKAIESQTLMAARNAIDALISKMTNNKETKNIHEAPSKLFAEKLVALWGNTFFDSGAASGRLAKAGTRSTRSSGRTLIRSLSNLSDEEQKWKQTLFLLENFLNYTKALDENELENSDFEGFDAILKPLNILLKISLDMDELYDNSYTLDILLSSIHVVIDLNSKTEKENNDSTNPELIVQCIRTCKTPDTKATALLILAKQASCASSAEYVMHNSIPIFTFMGSHFLKIEAKSSFDVACQAIDIIIPHIQRACLEKEKAAKVKHNLLRQTSLSIVNTFVDASSDMPPHRFKTFMSQLVKNLSSSAFQTPFIQQNAKGNQTDNYLWIVTLLLLKVDSKRRIYTGKGHETESIKLTAEEKHHQLRELYNAFDNDITFQMEAILKMLSQMKNDTPEIRTLLGIKVENEAMDVDGQNGAKLSDSTKQFETLRIKMMFFVSSGLLHSKHFVGQIIEALEVELSTSVGNDSEAYILQNQLRSLIEISIVNMENYEQNAVRKHRGHKSSKIQQQLAMCCERVLEAALGILPTFSFINLLKSLLSNRYSIVRKKSLEVLNAKLQQISYGKSKEQQLLMYDSSLGELLKVLVTIAQGKVPFEEEDLQNKKEQSINQQIALMCLRSFARATHGIDSSMHLQELKEVCKTLSKKTFLKESLEENGDDSVVAAILLCLTETFSCIGPHAVVMLPSFIDWVLEIMSCMSYVSQTENENTNKSKIKVDSSVVLSSVILAIQKCMDNFGGFLNPYYGRFVTASCRLTWIYQREGFSTSEHDAKKSKVRNIDRIQHLHSSMSKGIPTHSLIDIVTRCHQELSKESTHCIIALANILKENVAQLDKNGALAVSGSFLDYFLNAFKYRQSARDSRKEFHSNNVDVNVLEDKLIDAFLALALKLPLDDFKPMFYRLVNMAVIVSIK